MAIISRKQKLETKPSGFSNLSSPRAKRRRLISPAGNSETETREKLDFFRRSDYSDKAVRLIPARPSSCCNRLQSDNDRLIIRCVGSAIIFVIDRFLFMAMDGLSPACVGSFGDVMAGFCFGHGGFEGSVIFFSLPEKLVRYLSGHFDDSPFPWLIVPSLSLSYRF
ncbi:unnamed protein product [Arabidopsis thaliana]|uniref:Transmembrane protein n=1 Tax=Arabidopsis thaliana TaxID=3702 RepID=Q9LSS1_ARATH|nr:unnamed protein product [Arabidopsis thaliana]